jgi:mono/diheme cytochrome c family protein
VVIPGLLATAFFLMPFLDRGLERRPWRRPIPALAVAVVVLAMIGLGIRSRVEDSRGPAAAQLARQHEQELAYNAAPFEPHSPDRSGAALVRASVTPAPDPGIARGKGVFLQHGCVGCHGPRGTGSDLAPSLVGVTHKFSQQQISALLHNPNPRMKAAGMPTLTTDQAETDALIEYLGALGTAAASVPPQMADPAPATPEAAPTAARDPRASTIHSPQDLRTGAMAGTAGPGAGR